MRQLYSAAWFNFCNNPINGSYALPFELVAQMYPANLDQATLTFGNETGEIGLVPVLQEGYDGGLITVLYVQPFGFLAGEYGIGAGYGYGRAATGAGQRQPLDALCTEPGQYSCRRKD